MSFAHRPRLELETLDGRIVPTVLDLTSAGAQVVTPSGAIFRQADPMPADSVHSFVRLQQGLLGSLLGGTEQGYNTSARPLQFDESTDPQLTRSLTLGEVPVVSVDGLTYREFLLTINQSALSKQLSLDEARVFIDASGGLNGYSPSTNLLAGRKANFDLDAMGDVSIRMKDSVSGSSTPDVVLLVPDSAFNGASPNAFIYLYSRFGGVSGASANGGFEQWAVGDVADPPPAAPPAVPPATGSLSGTVFIDQDRDGMMEESEPGQAGVTVYLSGNDSQGNAVSLQTTTGEDGTFAFTNIPVGVYTLSEDAPFGYASESATAGNKGGDAESGQVSNITMQEGDQATDYFLGNVYSE